MDEYSNVVYETQGYLRTIALENPRITLLVPDGIFGDKTVNAVKEFQAEQGLPVTGRVDFETWKHLVNENKRIKDKNAAPIQVAPITQADLPLRKGDQNSFVLTLQQMLMRLFSTYSNIKRVQLSGIFDTDTEIAVSQWQNIARIPTTGVVDKETWDLLSQFYLIKKQLRNK